MSDELDGDDEELDKETQERVDRVRGKRDSRPSRRRRGSGTTSDREPESEQSPQAAQGEQATDAEQTTEAEREADTMTTDSQTEAGQAQKPEQPPQAAQEQQSNVSSVAELEPVTQREHDTYYLDEDVREELERVYRRMSLDLLEETGVDLDEQRVGGRNRYFRPLALLLGAREIADMSPEELRETVEQEGLIDDLPDENE
ncbi:hypothetical protein [Halorubrum tropicale]|uniref:hypothetical protein n=1 Tax=Halorubrum tropicale TaxID=1765655 RepID=UPI000AF09D83|nr:hypothetical protein [Halorubrum tropicale]